MGTGARATFVLTATLLGCNALSGVSALSVNVDASGGKAGVDGGASPSDAAAKDAQADVTASPVDHSFCETLSPKPTLCTDFDDGVFPGPWTVTTASTGTAALDGAHARSSPNAALLAVTSAPGAARLLHAFPATSQDVTIACAVRVKQRQPGDYQRITELRLGSLAGAAYRVSLVLLPNGDLAVHEEVPTSNGAIAQSDSPIFSSFPMDAWQRLSWHTTIGATSSSTVVTVEGAASAAVFLSAHTYNAPPEVGFGNGASSKAWSMRVDDLVVDLR